MAIREKAWDGDKNMGVNSLLVIFKAMALDELTQGGGRNVERNEQQLQEGRVSLVIEAERRSC